MATLHLLSIAASFLGIPSTHLEDARSITPACHQGNQAPVTFLQHDLAHVPMFRLLYGTPGTAARRMEAFLHFYSPIKSQSENQFDASCYFRLLRTC